MGTSTSYTPGYADVFWGSNMPNGQTFDTPPSSMSGAYSVNGSTPTIWQYFSGNKDADIASRLPC
jgi:hypothetical protein